MHIDHDGGLAHFRHSRILASSEEIARTAGIGGAILGYLPKRWPKWFAPEPLAWQPTAYGVFARSARNIGGGRCHRGGHSGPYAEPPLGRRPRRGP